MKGSDSLRERVRNAPSLEVGVRIIMDSFKNDLYGDVKEKWRQVEAILNDEYRRRTPKPRIPKLDSIRERIRNAKTVEEGFRIIREALKNE